MFTKGNMSIVLEAMVDLSCVSCVSSLCVPGTITTVATAAVRYTSTSYQPTNRPMSSPASSNSAHSHQVAWCPHRRTRAPATSSTPTPCPHTCTPCYTHQGHCTPSHTPSRWAPPRTWIHPVAGSTRRSLWVQQSRGSISICTRHSRTTETVRCNLWPVLLVRQSDYITSMTTVMWPHLKVGWRSFGFEWEGCKTSDLVTSGSSS